MFTFKKILIPLIPVTIGLFIYPLYDLEENILQSHPEYYLWAWRRNENLSFINTSDTKIALWLATIKLSPDEINVEARENSLIYPDGAKFISVIRIEGLDQYDSAITDELVYTILSIIQTLESEELQIDFDARVSQRGFYRELLEGLRNALPEKRLSITALASWCFGDPWIKDLPIDAAIPMIYRMGKDEGYIRHFLSDGGQVSAKICEDNIAYSTDEAIAPAQNLKRVFLYKPAPWDEKSFREFKEKIQLALGEGG